MVVEKLNHDIIEAKEDEDLQRLLQEWVRKNALYLADIPLGGIVEFGFIKVQIRDRKPALATLEITIRLD